MDPILKCALLDAILQKLDLMLVRTKTQIQNGILFICSMKSTTSNKYGVVNKKIVTYPMAVNGRFPTNFQLQYLCDEFCELQCHFRNCENVLELNTFQRSFQLIPQYSHSVDKISAECSFLKRFWRSHPTLSHRLYFSQPPCSILKKTTFTFG